MFWVSMRSASGSQLRNTSVFSPQEAADEANGLVRQGWGIQSVTISWERGAAGLERINGRFVVGHAARRLEAVANADFDLVPS